MLVADVAAATPGYLARFGYVERTGIIHDPTQTAYVQFLHRPGETVYLELVAPDGPQSKLANALAKGTGLHHVCHSTPDIEAAVVHLRRQQMLLVLKPTPAVAFDGRRIAWLAGRDRLLLELVERGPEGSL